MIIVLLWKVCLNLLFLEIGLKNGLIIHKLKICKKKRNILVPSRNFRLLITFSIYFMIKLKENSILISISLQAPNIKFFPRNAGSF